MSPGYQRGRQQQGYPQQQPQRGAPRPTRQMPTPQGYGQDSRGRGGHADARSSRPGAAPARRRRRPGRVILTVLVALLVGLGALWIYVDSSLTRVDALPEYAERPADTPGTTWLLVGSDARDDLTEEQKASLATGDAAGRRTDTIMLLHVPDGSGKSTLVSIPRDSYVDIPGNGRNKVNAAFAFGGPQLLAQTVEGATGLRVDRYVEVGFGGFADIVDAVGGVDMCIDEPLQDPLAGLDLQAGCQELDGTQALGFVRTRAFATADLQRVQNQREFLSALSEKATSVSTLINPFRSVPLMFAATDAVSVGDDEHLHNLAGLVFGMGGGVNTVTVPVGGTPTVDVGSVVQWDREKALRLFEALGRDEAVPEDLLQQPG
ncbi:LCP family protein [Umezawaea beigongshangensis]|uniref:LCP family protein n=1 Tax=Umezawaea beigongshangensis TaxID=2780383 RepID=UPI001E59230E|nr:LCP family protein [Umezawaea beigongshangensis]